MNKPTPQEEIDQLIHVIETERERARSWEKECENIKREADLNKFCLLLAIEEIKQLRKWFKP